MKRLLLGTAIVALVGIVTTPSFAAGSQKKPSHRVNEMVGYVETDTVVNDRDAEFRKIDTSGDGAINFKEFQRYALLDNEYEMFKMNDTNNDDLLTIDEYRVFSKWGPERVAYGPGQTTYNFNRSGVESK